MGGEVGRRGSTTLCSAVQALPAWPHVFHTAPWIGLSHLARPLTLIVQDIWVEQLGTAWGQRLRRANMSMSFFDSHPAKPKAWVIRKLFKC